VQPNEDNVVSEYMKIAKIVEEDEEEETDKRK
jgi:hypothetical protein